MIVINVEAVTTVIYAQSALYYHLHGGERPAVLCRDQQAALEECVRGGFATMILRLYPYMSDVRLEDCSMLGCELREEYGGTVQAKHLRAILETALAHYVIHLVAMDYDHKMSDRYLAQYLTVIGDLEASLSGCNTGVRLTTHYL